MCMGVVLSVSWDAGSENWRIGSLSGFTLPTEHEGKKNGAAEGVIGLAGFAEGLGSL